ncbi:hypothetical protein A0H77_19480 [Vibrio alginolyticus]|uniref:hypothetical protein n=1 Tax=Vibrio alginolyticus TaxID=663 RepID=UPI0007967893|nr:hypothetical protein [Vibrio alginolyticus]KXZ35080.1 hypothetical protein A0H77_19480 [Vibrio alginolyticus]
MKNRSEQEIIEELKEEVGQYIELGNCKNYLLKISHTLLEDFNLIRFLDFTCDIRNEFSITGNPEHYKVIDIDEYRKLTQFITFYETVDVYDFKYSPAEIMIFNPVDMYGIKAQLLILTFVDENNKTWKELKLLENYSREVNHRDSDLLSHFDEYECFQDCDDNYIFL